MVWALSAGTAGGGVGLRDLDPAPNNNVQNKLS